MKRGLKFSLFLLMMGVMLGIGSVAEAAVPAYSYTGTSSTSTDSNYWYIYLKSSGTLKFTSESPKIDAFLVGGGGGGAQSWYDSNYGQGGGGGGYTKTVDNISLTSGTGYAITIGAGGAGLCDSERYAGTGGTTSAFNYSAAGGGGAKKSGSGNSLGGTGGSNGGTPGNAGSNGAYAFGDSSLSRYGAGGGGGGNAGAAGAAGGANGGGTGGNGYSNPAGQNGTANTGGGGGGAGGNGGWSCEEAGGTGGSGIVIIRGCLAHKGGTHANGGKCTTCGVVYQTHSQSSTVSSYTKTSTQHTPNYACSYSGCTTTYAGTAANHSGATHNNGGKCTVCEYVYETHSQSTAIVSYTQTSTQHTPIYACTLNGCSGTYAGTTELHSGGGENDGMCGICGMQYQTHSPSTNIVTYKQTETQHTPIYECNVTNCTQLYLGTAENHSGATHNNGGKCTVCGYVYETHGQSETVVSYTQQETGHIPVYGCTYSGCASTYTGTLQLHDGTIELHVANSSCESCGWGSENTGGTYVLTINYNDTVVTKDVESGRIVTLGIGSRVDATYTVTTGNAVLKMYGTRRQFVMPAENVTITIQDI